MNNFFFFFAKHVEMVDPTTNELRIIAGKKGIKNYKNMSREKSLMALLMN